MAAGGSRQLQICSSSRHYPHISIGRGLSLVVEEQPEHGQDIETYISKQLTCPDGQEKEFLSGNILKKSARIFPWVVLVVDMLNQLDDRGAPLSEMQARLETIPAGLDKLFRDILLQSDHGIEVNVLFSQWLVFGMRPLEPAELFVAIEYSQSPADPDWSPPSPILPTPLDRLTRYILNCSHGPVEVAEASKGKPPVVQFIHETVREFLTKDNGLVSIVPALTANLVGISHEILRVACLRCVSAHTISVEGDHYCIDGHKSNANRDKFISDMRRTLPFLDYAILHRFKHAEQAQNHEISQQQFLKGQMDEHGVWSHSYRRWWNVLERFASRKSESDARLSYFVVKQKYFGLMSVLPNLPRAVQKSSGGLALELASFLGNSQVVQLLLEAGANVNRVSNYERAPLHRASIGGQEKVVQQLLDAGVEFDQIGDFFRSALLRSSFSPHNKVVWQLLKAEADIHIRTKAHDTVLDAASQNGHAKVAQLLLDELDVLIQGDLGTALHEASRKGHEKVVRVLLDAGTNVNAKANGPNTPLHYATRSGHAKVVQLLLESGADVNAQGTFSDTALCIASQEPREEIVQLLLNAGADVNARDQKGGTAVHKASEGGHVEIVHLLLDQSDVIKQEDIDAALGEASRGGHKETVQLLSARGADVNAQGATASYTALYQAAIAGHEEVVKLLLEAGADVNMRCSNRVNVLWAATKYGHPKVAELLRAAKS